MRVLSLIAVILTSFSAGTSAAQADPNWYKVAFFGVLTLINTRAVLEY